jgi:hypothetical protein
MRHRLLRGFSTLAALIAVGITVMAPRSAHAQGGIFADYNFSFPDNTALSVVNTSGFGFTHFLFFAMGTTGSAPAPEDG